MVRPLSTLRHRATGVVHVTALMILSQSHFRPQEDSQPSKHEAISLCQGCSTIFSGADVSSRLRSHSGVKIHKMRWDMMQTAIQGCELCRQLLPTWLEDTEDKRGYASDKKFAFSFHWSQKAANQIVARRHRRLGHALQTSFDISTRLDDPASTMIPYRTINNDVNCEQTYNLIRRWLKDCDRNHTECATSAFGSKTALLPSHLIAIGAATDSTDMVHLEKTKDVTSSINYAALSYCWGTGQKHVTTMDNYATYLGRIEVCTLPQTLQDAILVTRRIGLQYLWVDSLCIVQDAEDDKYHELGRMHYIYNNAYVVVIASVAASCDDGFLGPRDFKRPPTKVPFGSANGHVYLQKPLVPSLPGLFGIFDSQNPIDTRAWTFQEEFLSRRALFFGSYQIIWTCGKLTGQDGGSMADGVSACGGSFSCRDLHLPKPSNWVSIAETYSCRALSYPCDKLPAVSSVAEYFSSHTGHRYAAGLWLEGLPYQLCWKSSSSSSPAKVWRAPSWTWMSVDGSIHFPDLDELRFDPLHLTADILDCRTTPLYNEVPFGQVTSGYLDIRGRILCCHAVWDMDSERTKRFWIKEFISSKTKNKRKGGELDFDSVLRPDSESCAPPGILTCQGKESGEGGQVYCLLLCRKQRVIPGRARIPGSYGDYGTPDVELWLPFGVALRRLKSGEFYRVGVFEGNRSSLDAFAKVNSQTIRII